MLRESLETFLADQSDIEIELVEPEPVAILAAVERTGADAVVLTMPESGEPGLTDHLLYEYPDLLVIALSPSEENGFVYRLVIDKKPLKPVTSDGILAAIRGLEKNDSTPLSGAQEA